MSMTTPEEELAELKRKYAEQAKQLEAVSIMAQQKATDAAWLKTEAAVAGLMLGVAYDGLVDLVGPETVPGDHEVKFRWLTEKLEAAMVDITRSQKREAAIDMLKYADLLSANGGQPVGLPRPPGPDDDLSMFGQRS